MAILRHRKNPIAISDDASATPRMYVNDLARSSIASTDSAKAGGMRALRTACSDSTDSVSTATPAGVKSK